MFFLKKRITKLFALITALALNVQAIVCCTSVFAEVNDVSPEQVNLITYSAPNPNEVTQPENSKLKYEWSDMYSVKVRPKGSGDNEWKDLAVFKARVHNINTQEAAFVYFDCDGPIEVQVDCKNVENVESVGALNEKTSVNPASCNIEPKYEKDSKIMTFTVQPNQRLVVDPNGDTRHSLHIFANTQLKLPDENALKGKDVTYVDASKGDILQREYDSDVVYVKEGFYNNSISIKSNQIWYIDGGAVIRGGVNLDNTKNAKLIGHGVFYRPDGRALSMDNSEGSYVEGVIVCNYGALNDGGCLASISNSKNMTLKNVKSIACNRWSDAIDIFTSENVTIEDCFTRSGDDCIALYGPRWNGKYWGDTGNVRNIKVSGCVLMPDRARPIHFATHGDGTSPNGGRVFDNFIIKDVDILTYNTYAVDNNGGALPIPLSFNACDGNMVTNAYFEDIRIQDAGPNQILSMNISTTSYGSVIIPGRGINNVYFKDVNYTNPNSNFGATIKGYDKSDGTNAVTKNVTFENLVVNGNVVTRAEDANITIGNYAENIKFVKSGEAKYTYNSAIVPEDIWSAYYDYTQYDGVMVSASNSEKESKPEAVLDNNESTVWYSHIGNGEPNEAYTDESNQNVDDLHGITIDLGAVRHLQCIRITWKDAGGYKYRMFTSKDGKDWGALSDEQIRGSLNPKADTDYKRVKWNWLANQRFNLEGRYVKIVPCDGYQLAIAEIAVLGEDEP